MEPTTNIKDNKTKIIVIVLVVLAIIIGVLIVLRSKTEAPASVENTPVAQQESNNQLTSDIDNATTFDNEPALKEIDSQF